jgi:hypothetical protein
MPKRGLQPCVDAINNEVCCCRCGALLSPLATRQVSLMSCCTAPPQRPLGETMRYQAATSLKPPTHLARGPHANNERLPSVLRTSLFCRTPERLLSVLKTFRPCQTAAAHLRVAVGQLQKGPLLPNCFSAPQTCCWYGPVGYCGCWCWYAPWLGSKPLIGAGPYV